MHSPFQSPFPSPLHQTIDTDPPGGFSTNSAPILQPIPFAVKAYSLPDLFAGKMHTVLCRKWKNRVKGRDWYDLIWYAGNYPRMHLAHLEQRMRQSDDYADKTPLTEAKFRILLDAAIANLDIKQAQTEVAPFLRDPDTLSVWSKEFFTAVADKIQLT